MLPARWKRFAQAEDDDLPRLLLVEHWQLALIAVLMMGLFALIFPREALVERLYGQNTLDALTLAYVENLQRTEPDNPGLAILLARTQQHELSIDSLERLLLPVTLHGDTSQQHEANRLLLAGYERALQQALTPAAHREVVEHLRKRLLALRTQELSREQTVELAFLAFRIEDLPLGLGYLQRSGSLGQAVIAQRMAAQGREALGLGQYQLASEFYRLARTEAGSRDEARLWFRESVATLMAAQHHADAMQLAAQELKELSDDAATLRYLTRTALAAGQPQQAAHYARLLLQAREEG